jgi:hypothetical protein
MMMLIGVCEWLIDALWGALGETVHVEHDAEGNGQPSTINAHAPGTAPVDAVDADNDPF